MIARQASDEQDDRLQELFESSAWSLVLDRIKTHLTTKKGTLFSGTLSDADVIRTTQEVRGARLAFQHLYASANVPMPPDLLRVFE